METSTTRAPQAIWNPYVAGFGLGLTLLLSFALLGAGLGASGSLARVGAAGAALVAPEATHANEYLAPWFTSSASPASASVASPLANYLIFLSIGTLLGGAASAWMAGRTRVMVERGPRVSARTRLVLAVVGGLLVGFASRMAGGCTSGQALTGGALLLPGSWVFLGALFAVGFLVAPLVRREWRA